MFRVIVIVVIGLFLGLHPKKVPVKELIIMAVANLLIVLCLIGSGVIFGLNPLSVAKLQEASIIVSALTMFYAIQLGVTVKLIKVILAK